MGSTGGLEGIIKKIKKKVQVATMRTAQDLEKELLQDYREAVSAFYDEYSPKFYTRTYSTYKGSYGVKLRKEGDGYSIYLPISAKYLGRPYRAYDTEWVFERTYMRGIHGYLAGETGKIHEGKLLSYLAGKYSYEPKSLRIKNVPKRDKSLRRKEYRGTSPNAIMNGLFVKSTGKRHIQSIFNQYFSL